jgi:F-type H+-transporting ATPase subunit delta
MISIRIARRYAKALMATTTSIDHAEELLRDLTTMVDAQKASPEFRAMMRSPVIQASKKKGVLQEAFGQSVKPEVLAFVDLLADKGREGELDTITSEFSAMVDVQRNRVRVSITSAVELDEATRANTTKALSANLGATVVPTWTVDAALLGGITVHVAGKVIDGSLLGNLRRLRDTLASGKAPSNN